MQRKLKLFGLLASISALAVIFLFWYSNRDQITIPTTTIQPTPILIPLRLENIIPPAGKQEMVFPNSSITFVFNQKLKALGYTADINPKIKFEIELDFQNPQVLYLRPKQDWIFNQTYSITLTAQPAQGLPIEKPITYSFTPIRPTKGQEVD